MVLSRQNLSTQIADFVLRFRKLPVPANVRSIAKLHLLDGLATMVGGAGEAASRIVRSHLLQLGGKRESIVLGTSVRLPCQQAALANGVQAHVLDYDDAQLANSPSRPPGQQTHPTSPVLAAALALAVAKNLSGSELLTAYIVGVEVACRLGDAIDPSHYLNGFHPTGTIGSFGAAAACTHLLKLETEQIHWAMGIAGSLASGVRANRGTMAKSLSAGRAAENGVIAATLVQQGFTAASDVFENPMGYFNAACRKGVDRRRLLLGSPFFFESPGVAIKLYACAGVLHPLLELVIDQVRRHDIHFNEIVSIRVGMRAQDALPLVYNRPADGLQAKFSLPFAAAVAAVDRAAGLEQFTDERVRDPVVQNLMKRVEHLRSRSRARRRTDVEILLNNGKRFCASASVARGHPRAPATRHDIEAKFLQCGLRVVRPGALNRFLRSFWSLENVSSISSWLDPLRLRAR